MSVLIRKHNVGIENCPEEQQDKRLQTYPGQLSAGSVARRQGCNNCHQQHDMKKEQRVGNRVLRDLDVQSKFVVKLNVLVQGPQAISGRKKEPEYPISKPIPDSILDRESGRQK